jgi:hypothetical protein
MHLLIRSIIFETITHISIFRTSVFLNILYDLIHFTFFIFLFRQNKCKYNKVYVIYILTLISDIILKHTVPSYNLAVYTEAT